MMLSLAHAIAAKHGATLMFRDEQCYMGPCCRVYLSASGREICLGGFSQTIQRSGAARFEAAVKAAMEVRG